MDMNKVYAVAIITFTAGFIATSASIIVNQIDAIVLRTKAHKTLNNIKYTNEILREACEKNEQN